MIFVDGVEVLKLPQRYIIITLNCKNSEINFKLADNAARKCSYLALARSDSASLSLFPLTALAVTFEAQRCQIGEREREMGHANVPEWGVCPP